MSLKIIIIAVLALWASSLGGVPLLDWDEANFAEVAREMVMSGDWSFVKVGFEPFWEKPPLFMWVQAASFQLFGINEFAARFPNLIVAAFTFLFILFVGRKRSQAFARIWMMSYAISFLPSFYFRTGLIDPLFNLFIFSAIIFWFEFERTHQLKEFVLSIILIASGIMTKGPTALLILAVTVGGAWCLDFRSRFRLKNVGYLALLIVSSIVPYSIWMRHQGSLNQGKVTTDFMSYLVRLFATADAGHGGFPLYHVVVLGLGCLPLSLTLWQGWKIKDTYRDLMRVLLVAVVVIFSLVQTKIIHYSSLAYFPLTYLGALAIDESIKVRESIPRFVFIGMGVFFTILFFLPIALYMDSFVDLIRDQDIVESIQLFRQVDSDRVKVLSEFFLVLFTSMGFAFSKIKFQWNDRRVLIVLIVISQLWVADVVPRISEITQGSLIAFYKRAATENVNIQPLGFKSYAAYFYSHYDPKRGSPVYAVSRARDQEWAMKNHKLNLIEKKGGWALYRMLR